MLGFDLVWYGVLYTITCQIAYMTPPFGYNLFLDAGHGAARNHDPRHLSLDHPLRLCHDRWRLATCNGCSPKSRFGYPDYVYGKVNAE